MIQIKEFIITEPTGDRKVNQWLKENDKKITVKDIKECVVPFVAVSEIQQTAANIPMRFVMVVYETEK